MSKYTSLQDVFDEIEVPDSEDEEVHTIGMVPPIETANADTDVDSDLSDGEEEGNIDHLPCRLLVAPATTTTTNDSDWEDEDLVPLIHLVTSQPTTSVLPPAAAPAGPPPAKTRKIAAATRDRVWRDVDTQFTVPIYTASTNPCSLEFIRQKCESELDVFKYFFNQNFVELLVTESNRYAGQKGKHDLNLTTNDVYASVGVLQLSGYHRLPNRRMYWKNDSDCQVTLVADNVRRNRFEEFLRFLHLTDNSLLDGTDRLAKVRPIFSHMNNILKSVPVGSCCSIDESIIPYFGRHSGKQFIRGKPIRFGFKLWCLCDPSGYLYHAEPYCGSSTDIADVGFGQGGNVVMSLVNKCDLLPGTRIYFDNLFTSVPLLDELTKMQLGGTGTLRRNRITPSMKLPTKQEAKKGARGDFTRKSSGALELVTWNDNAPVVVLSNCDGLQPMKVAQRYSRVQQKRISVNMPGSIAAYNSAMGGVDQNDGFLAMYRTKIRTKKWWWPFFAWAMDQSMVAAWLLYRRTSDDTLPFLEFKRRCVISLLKTHGAPRRSSGPQTSSAMRGLQFEGGRHIIARGESKYKVCQLCRSRSVYFCRTCEVTLHPDCFESYHS